MQLQYAGFAATSIIVFSTIPACIKLLSLDPIAIGFCRLTIGALLLGTYLGLHSKLSLRAVLANLKPLSLVGLIFGSHYFFYFSSIQLSSATIGILLLCSAGPIQMYFGRFFGLGQVQFADYLAIVLSITGVVILLPLGEEFTKPENSQLVLGIICGVLSGASLALLPIAHQSFQETTPSVKAFGQFFFSAIFFLPFLVFSDWGSLLNPSSAEFKSELYLILYLSIIGTFVAHSLWVQVLTYFSVTLTSVILYLPVFGGILVNSILLGEELTPKILFGGSLILSANVISIYDKAKRGDAALATSSVEKRESLG